MDIGDMRNEANGWRSWRRDTLKPLWGALRNAVGNQNVLVEGETAFEGKKIDLLNRLETFVTWEATNAEPPFAALFRTADSVPDLAGKPVTFVVIVGNPDNKATPENLLSLMKRDDKPEITVWDLSNRSLPGVRERLRNLARRRGAL